MQLSLDLLMVILRIDQLQLRVIARKIILGSFNEPIPIYCYPKAINSSLFDELGY